MVSKARLQSCQGHRKDGSPCRGQALPSGSYCFAHAPELADKRREVRKRGGANSARRARLLTLMPPRLMSVYNRLEEALSQVLPAAEKAGMGVIAKRPIANARLADAESPVHRDGAHWDSVRSLLEEHGVWDDPLELSLRFTLSHDAISSAIVGTSNVDHARDNVRRAEGGPLPAEVMDALHSLEPRE